jgi:hypothetical protein
MFDVEQRRRISVEELRDLLVVGENFEAETEESGRDCTVEVLRKVMGGGALDPMSGQTGFPMPGLGALSVVNDLMGLAKSVNDRSDFDRDDRWDDRREPRRDDRRRSRPPAARPWTGPGATQSPSRACRLTRGQREHRPRPHGERDPRRSARW